ncbi:hypothetical protein ITR01_00260 [Pediococcus pentosaceus]|uniref:hypothetical protein n=1 Tax=Pediococcus pentosaceus TaxID=1255 RepID=UPI0018A19789|nr:hypothetical protein [Pediococcus pentosaceus]MBF7122870.1 hypothetical protein [Pediococcus pentosaceus]
MKKNMPKTGKKLHKYGEDWDSEKELAFYERFILNKVPPELITVHESFGLIEKMWAIYPAVIPSWKYTPDIVIRNKAGQIEHVYDVKNSFSDYGISTANKLTFKQFARIYGVPVEAVVVRTHDFKTACVGVTKQLDLHWTQKKQDQRIKDGKKPTKPPLIKTSTNYPWIEATNYEYEQPIK